MFSIFTIHSPPVSATKPATQEQSAIESTLSHIIKELADIKGWQAAHGPKNSNQADWRSRLAKQTRQQSKPPNKCPDEDSRNLESLKNPKLPPESTKTYY